jgi:anti-anti-sigma factor
VTTMQIGISRNGGAARVELKGEFDLGSAADVERELSDLERDGPELIVLDLRELTFIDSTGLRSILAADARARREGRRVVVVPGPPTVHRVFRIALLDQRLEFVEDPESLKGANGDGD